MNMSFIVGIFIVLFGNICSIVDADHVVFVHGLAGFGPDEFFGVSYWGFYKVFSSQNYLEQVRRHGHQVHYASVGPVSSNHDRACELYAQIKGTIVDYGKVHSERYGHARYGYDYRGRGFFPDWDGSNRIHFVGHSMGGNTIRYLEYLLQNGLQEEVDGTTDGSVSDLFKRNKRGGNTWIQSMHTISTPHDGSPLHTQLGGTLVKFIKDLLAALAAIAGLLPSSTEWLYDFDLDQFGLTRQFGEGFWDYHDRVFSSSIWNNNFHDLASWDLSPEACRDFNRKTKLAYPDTYYFSYSTSQTKPCLFNRNDQCWDLEIELAMAATANIIGDVGGNACDSTGYCFDDSWEKNDGLVPVRSSASPRNGVSGYVSPITWSSNSNLRKARWYNRHYDRDHIQIIGLRFNPLVSESAEGVYEDIANSIDSVKTSSFFLRAGEGDISGNIMSKSVPLVVVIGVAGAILAVSLSVFAVVRIRRRRHEMRMVSTFGSSPAQSVTTASFASPRKFSKKQLDRGSITLRNEQQESDNPVFSVVDDDQDSDNPVFAIDASSSMENETPSSKDEGIV